MDRVNKIKEFAKELGNKMKNDEAQPYAHQLTYSLLLAIFPFLIFLMTVIGFMNLDSATILNQLQRVMPGDTFTMFSGIITEVMEKQSGGLLSVSIIAAIWASASGFKAFMTAMNKVHDIREERSFLKLNFQAVINVIALALVISLSLFLLVFSDQIFLTISGFTGKNLDFLKSFISKIIPLVFIFGMFIMFYMFVPAKNIKFKHAMPGAIFATIAFTIVSLGFKFYVDNFGNYSKFYGALGAVIVLMLWLLIMSNIMIIGGEINSLIIIRKNVFNPFISKSALEGKTISEKAINNIKKVKDSDIHRRL